MTKTLTAHQRIFNYDCIDRLAEFESYGWSVRNVAMRSDHYTYYLMCRVEDGVYRWRVVAGCRTMTIGEYRRHVTMNYRGSRSSRGKRKEVLAILDMFEAFVKANWSRPG